MALRITKTISSRPWGDVDKGRIWRILKDALTAGATDAAEAVREVYAVVKASIGPDLTGADCWGAHHEIREDGEIVLNRDGLGAAAASLAGARSEPNLTAEQKAEARRHLLRHYAELGLAPPGGLAGETTALAAAITGEMRPSEIPLAPGVNLAALKAGDEDPMEVVVEVPAGKSKRGWNYTPAALQRIVGEVMRQGLPGFLGHQKPEDVEHEFPTPVTHWVGAIWRDGKAYFRGVVDKAASDLKRWIRAGTVKTVSIYGLPKLQQVGSEINVVDYGPLSIDWTPLGRAGMQTSIVAIGEMDVIGELDGSHEELRDALHAAVRSALGDNAWVYRVFSDYCIARRDMPDGEVKHYRISYGLIDGKVRLGEPVEVVKIETYQQIGGEMTVSWKELVAKLRAALVAGECSIAQIVGELGIKVKQIVGEMKAQDVLAEIDPAYAKEAASAIETLGRVKAALGVTGEMDVVKVATDAAAAVKAKRAADHEKLVGEVLNEKVAGEMNQVLVRKLLTVQEGATREQIAGEIDKLLADESLRETFSRLHLDKPAAAGGGAGQDQGNGLLRERTVAI